MSTTAMVTVEVLAVKRSHRRRYRHREHSNGSFFRGALNKFVSDQAFRDNTIVARDKQDPSY